MNLWLQDRLTDAAVALIALAAAAPALLLGWHGWAHSTGAIAPWLWAGGTAIVAWACGSIGMVLGILMVPGALAGCEMCLDTYLDELEAEEPSSPASIAAIGVDESTS